MKKIKRRNIKLFWRTFCISNVIAFCIILGLAASAKAYENTIRIGYGIYKPAVEWNENEFRIFDFTVYKK